MKLRFGWLVVSAVLAIYAVLLGLIGLISPRTAAYLWKGLVKAFIEAAFK